MRTLLIFSVVLMVEMASGAPQPLAALDSANVDDSGSEETEIGEKRLAISTTLAGDSLSLETTNSPPVMSDKSNISAINSNSSEYSEDEEKNSGGLTTSNEKEDLLVVSTTNSRPPFETNLELTSSSAEVEEITASVTELPLKEEGASEIYISRYVPPLDPMKHMLMMEAKKKLQVSTTNMLSEITTISSSTAKSEIPLVEVESSTSVNLKDEIASAAEEKFQIISNSNTAGEAKENSLSESSSPNSSEELYTNAPVTTELSMTTNKVSTDINPDIIHESSILLKSSELFSGENQEMRNDVASTESSEFSSTDVVTETSTHSDSTTLRNSFTTTQSSTSHTSTANESTTSEEVTDTLTLERSGDEIFATVFLSPENDTSPTTERFDKLDEKENTESVESSNSTTQFTTSSTPLFDLISTTMGTLEKLLSSQNENNKNVTLEVNLENREDLEEFNVNENDKEHDASTSAEVFLDKSTTNSMTFSEEETTISKLVTPSNEILFTSTETPMENKEEPDSSPFNSPPEIVKVELLESDINSISSNDTDASTTTVSELDSETKSSNADQSTTTLSSENIINTDKHHTTSYAETSTSSEVSSEEESLNSESVNSSEEQSIPAFSAEDSSKNETEIERGQSFFNMNTTDRYISGNNTNMVSAVQFLHHHDKASSEQCFKLVNAHWNYATDLTDENKKKQLEQTLEYALFHKEAWKNATSYAWKSFNDTLLRRWFKSLSVLGTAALPEDKLNEFNKLKAEMKNIYSTAKVCEYETKPPKRGRNLQKQKDCSLTLEPDLQRILAKSRDYDELTYVWQAWREVAGKPLREKYLRFVELSNEAARLNGFSDTGDMWREAYESDTFEDDLEALWNQLKPLYENLHAYVRRRLILEYGNDKIKDDGPIPAHLFGNMWAQSWVSLLDITQPFPGKPSVDVTPIMEAKNLSALEMFQISEEFFTSLGLKPMPEEFWKHSLIEKPKDREIICHASAWDFCNGKDYRIKQCTDITMEDLITVHHEMGHIQYFLQYARQPNVFREGANPGFHEAIGDVLALSASTPKHLQSIGLLEEVSDDPEGDLNFLLRTALDKVSFLPSGYLIDQWRWGLFSGDIKPDEMNTKWWDLRLKYQGICPPIKRQDTDFDPGAKYHVPGNVPYIRYFVSFVIQFQFHKVLCDASGHTGPLYKCDIYRSKEAGQILSQVMELGSSEHWSEAMKIMTGGESNRMDAGPILEYFQPLLDFLMEQNKNETIGWTSADSTICP
ncbi:hypothetical protein JTE90_010533 [Oedothorax gibbosus]|uniref:Angiotensin-converting enzyme n=1 Tax=Oedothorax gibbosus TaxID=931172 RepID=A0AAV6TUJ2_9ARAC|nr:hypothetical protein JTE90_010533 [Oedothorax gibbosus]